MRTSPTDRSVDEALAGSTALVAGGTGNVGRHIVRALLQRGATVIVPSRSPGKLGALRTAVGAVDAADGRLVTLVGDVADEHDAQRVRDEALQRLPPALDGVVASLGRWIGVPSLLTATRADLVHALENYVVAHFVVARTFLPAIAPGGSYTLINGPSALSTWPGSALVSVATAAQAMLARALAGEENVRGRIRFADLFIHPSSFIGSDAGTGHGPIDGDAVGRYVAGIIAGRVTGGPAMHLDSEEQLTGLT